jgi:hypothetical protein
MFVGGLMPQNDVEELGKLPDLVQHFRFHQSTQAGQLSVGRFMRMHYGEASSAVFRCPPSPEHEKLPLHGQHNCPNLEYVVPTAARVAHVRYLGWPSPVYRPAAAPRYAFAFRAALLQPPRA